jgi:hypothetical protein
MAVKTTYYAMVDGYSTLEEPAGVLRRVEDDQAEYDEAFTTALKWERSWSLNSYERGNTDVNFHQISAEEADRIVERIRRSVTGQP